MNIVADLTGNTNSSIGNNNSTSATNENIASSNGVGTKVVFKIKLDKEIRKAVIHNDDITYNELMLMMQRIFSDKIRPNDEFNIKYTDEGDKQSIIPASTD